ncbi:MAG: FAD binding domain-containing protein [Actinomycetota bacterium]
MITQYLRPTSLDEAAALLAHRDVEILAGGTSLNASPPHAPVTAVDLQALDLDGIDSQNGAVRIGATARLQELVDSPLVPPVLRELARREAPNTIRNAATVGGTIGVGDPESELLAGLLAYGTVVTLARSGSSTEQPLDNLLDAGIPVGSIITSVTVPTEGRAAADRTGRTPMDRPIVTAVAYADGGDVRLALTGVTSRPVLVDPARIGELDPPADFRGSAEYRLHLAGVLATRVLTALDGGDGQ